MSSRNGDGMPNRSEEFARVAEEVACISKAERQLCEEAGPMLSAIFRAMKAQAGLCITELRVTFDPARSPDGSIANCTIVRAHTTVPSADHDIRRAIGSMRAPSGGSSSDQK